MSILDPSDAFDFKSLHLTNPLSISPDTYFTRIVNKSTSPPSSLFVQAPPCCTKQGIIKSGKKYAMDLMFTIAHGDFVQWIENLETACQELLVTNAPTWFEDSTIAKDDIENAFTSALKLFKSGKFYVMRATFAPNMVIYNNLNEKIEFNQINSTTELATILEPTGVRFTEKSFQIDFEIKQAMTIPPNPFQNQCVIKTNIAPIVSSKENDNENDKEKDKEMNKEMNKEKAVIPNVELSIHENISMQDFDDVEEKTDEKAEEKIKADDDFKELSIDDLINEKQKEQEEEENGQEEGQGNATKEENEDGGVVLSKPHQIYYELYEKARQRAKEAKKQAITLFLEAKNIKNTYKLDNLDDSSESDFDENDFDDAGLDDDEDYSEDDDNLVEEKDEAKE